MDFAEEQLKRYSRHIILPEVGGKGQKKISGAKVFMIGAGGLGCPVGYYLAAAGVGTIAIIDNDTVELSNLQRQIAHSVKTLGVNKADSAKQTFEALNPDVNVIAIKERINSRNILDLIKDYDIVVDGSDNFPTRYLINDACVMLKKPLVSGAILRFEGQVTTIVPGEGPCYRCLFEYPPPPGLVPSCQEAGVLGVLPGVIGALQATEVLKLILGKGAPLKGQLLIYDALGANFRKVKIPKNPACPICGENPTITELTDSEEYCSI
ncbi:MAG TPA: molybdopterin-synthase adenylyltransferase MoeB [Nitrospirae bacterium]|nr:putative adenylyltransferase/sulfurtransferase MoeZ [bacterium BMS3Abin10]GBE38819.1 putative adenylyltransferase/sulfurtransferase MoeZ [bacterium BMS3Bbin08]HDH50045.1 molybdopterin-synthase adenylyltransferase MoeB [Nitrospirota bacterium]HDK41454.1 molybdopterin-synthase adenylyltransferase MoeB [Nitrospirota bacterium]HDK81094.1 molybdopterin-synthase adenylyltransferase MoeB [Nitrospirota bacterium]